MESEELTRVIRNFRIDSIKAQEESKTFKLESPIQRTKKEVRRRLASSENERVMVLHKVSTFSHISLESLVTVARSLEEMNCNTGKLFKPIPFITYANSFTYMLIALFRLH